MDRAELVQLIIGVVRDYAELAADSPGGAFTEETRLAGRDSLLDSMGLVSVVLDVEEQVNTALGASVSLASEQAMSRERSPFRTVGTLADYTLELLDAQRR